MRGEKGRRGGGGQKKEVASRSELSLGGCLDHCFLESAAERPSCLESPLVLNCA